MHGEFASSFSTGPRETEAHYTATGMPLQQLVELPALHWDVVLALPVAFRGDGEDAA